MPATDDDTDQCPILDIKVINALSEVDDEYVVLEKTFGGKDLRLAYSKSISIDGLN